MINIDEQKLQLLFLLTDAVAHFDNMSNYKAIREFHDRIEFKQADDQGVKLITNTFELSEISDLYFEDDNFEYNMGFRYNFKEDKIIIMLYRYKNIDTDDISFIAYSIFNFDDIENIFDELHRIIEKYTIYTIEEED